MSWTEEEDAEFRAVADPTQNGAEPAGEPLQVEVVTLEEFISIDEPGAAALVGDGNNVLIPEGGDIMIYGDGGAGKTTLSIDLACHLAAGEDWLEIPVARRARVLLIENEGPRALLRRKLRRKAQAWPGAALDGRVSVLESPWAQVSFATEEWRTELARVVRETEVDLIIVGPLTRIGMTTAGTLQEVAAFMLLIQDVREQAGRSLTVVLVHHENKSGAVSGAFEGSGDTLLHVTAAGNGHTIMTVQKARWDSKRHGETLRLAWTDGEGFEVEAEDRNLVAEITELLSDRQWRTAKEIAAPKKPKEATTPPGIGASDTTVKDILEKKPELFESRTSDAAKALGRHPSSTLWQLRSTPNAPNAPTAFPGGAEAAATVLPPLREAPSTDAPPTDPTTCVNPTNAPNAAPLATPEEEELLKRAHAALDTKHEP